MRNPLFHFGLKQQRKVAKSAKNQYFWSKTWRTPWISFKFCKRVALEVRHLPPRGLLFVMSCFSNKTTKFWKIHKKWNFGYLRKYRIVDPESLWIRSVFVQPFGWKGAWSKLSIDEHLHFCPAVGYFGASWVSTRKTNFHWFQTENQPPTGNCGYSTVRRLYHTPKTLSIF